MGKLTDEQRYAQRVLVGATGRAGRGISLDLPTGQLRILLLMDDARERVADALDALGVPYSVAVFAPARRGGRASMAVCIARESREELYRWLPGMRKHVDAAES